ncbi:DUF512 domain-containing protein [Heliophilum fasciatum]|uniref:Putative radical SAM enzyme (TIGR03279 family) n=1 Tax=Heliophilum fasciatum TaxID=35700 RepID=A0A4R2RIR2_9FIRM|nr:DUF512 domain-containing protein [Heliophilum fasciatum]MCW2278671.1 putative radical SAM enzyme (TIGR03279 family) [Heliophilum fasciatum]TCP62608.1 putative radical SAM enzyme (TIGR03279 family) [Heliophilum fasciatum]
MRTAGGLIEGVEPGGLAASLGIQRGDRLVRINGQAIHDVLDFGFFIRDRAVTLEVLPQGAQEPLCFHVQKNEDDDLGLSFAEATFDGMRRCHNRCLFCFVDQMPPGLRRSLYQKDDDYRHSFWHGNFITLTNMSDDDWARLLMMRLSPLYVSVQATDPAVRSRLLAQPKAAELMPRLRQLVDARMQVHTQIVCCPGVNDGEVLSRSFEDLWSLGEGLASVAVVPVGLTQFRQGLYPLRVFTPEEAAAVIDEVERWQAVARPERGESLFYAADELYLAAERPFPEAEAYDDFSQLENGIGISRLFIDSWSEQMEASLAGVTPVGTGRTFVIAGVSAERVLVPLLDQAQEQGLPGSEHIRLVAVRNTFFGPTVTVTGLLTGCDVVATLQALDDPPRPGDRVLLPATMLRADGDITLDSMTVAMISAALGDVTVEVIEADGGAFWSALWRRQKRQRKGRGLWQDRS